MSYSKAYFGADNKAETFKKAYIGIPKVKMTNLIPAINGVSGWTTGTSSTTHTKYSSSTILLTGSTSVPEVTTSTTIDIPMIAGHKYYVRAEVYFSSASTTRRNTCYWPIAEPSIWNTSSLGLSLAAEQWHLLAMITDRGSAGFSSGNYPLRLDFDNDYKTGEMWIDGVMCIDLTAAYGAGNEPTQDWCNTNLPYFTGVYELESNTAPSYATKVKKAYVGVDNKAVLWYDGTYI